MVENLIDELKSMNTITWKTITEDKLDLNYGILLNKQLADKLFQELESSVDYYDAETTKVKVFGKYHYIPRQQIAFSDPGIVYKFSGSAIPGQPWTPVLSEVKDLVGRLSGVKYNFVLINRYRNGNDNIGEHRDSEPELDPNAPIASLTLGQPRDFVLRHTDLIKKTRDVPKVKILLAHGSLLLMNPPTNTFWYHSLPPRRNANGIRINLTFRKFH